MKGELGLSYFFIKMQDLKSLFEGKIKGTIATGCDIDPKYLTDFVKITGTMLNPVFCIGIESVIIIY